MNDVTIQFPGQGGPIAIESPQLTVGVLRQAHKAWLTSLVPLSTAFDITKTERWPYCLVTIPETLRGVAEALHGFVPREHSKMTKERFPSSLGVVEIFVVSVA